MEHIGQLWTKKSPEPLLLIGILDFFGTARTTLWPPRQESNLYLTLRRRVHYPLCYEEVARILAPCAVLFSAH